uniref:Uncharacterized protein n=1 Tax=Branchiostoma floridae TaxID=7739 RepID=C3XWJ4_BRAFL|eukprot:XP_002611718.1 hypothetical protein BRAFLDRAFT_63591 [Branchiostoma floridae]
MAAGGTQAFTGTRVARTFHIIDFVHNKQLPNHRNQGTEFKVRFLKGASSTTTPTLMRREHFRTLSGNSHTTALNGSGRLPAKLGPAQERQELKQNQVCVCQGRRLGEFALVSGQDQVWVCLNLNRHIITTDGRIHCFWAAAVRSHLL